MGKIKKENNTPGSPSLGDPVLLKKIDQLFACNVGEHVNLPQLVVVGDQSSGKSSVLEGLTRLPFPRDSGLCTRFATQIIFRRVAGDTERKIVASVIPASDADADRASKLQAWKGEDLQSLSLESFSKMMAQVHELMGLSSKDTPEASRFTFSKDVLRLETTGPDEDHLSVIDVPGIFKNCTSGLTSKADINIVREMVLGYMKNPRSIILAVVPANVDIVTQEIIEMARGVDQDGERTLGVLTKPDLVDMGVEQRAIDLVEGNNGLYLKLGWVVVRNLNQKELANGNTDRDSAEESFRLSPPSDNLDPTKFGIKALRIRLQEIVNANVRRVFPRVSCSEEVTKRLKATRNALEALGANRETADQQRRYLIGVMDSFQEATLQALTSNYGANDMFDNDEELKLATEVVNREITFAEDVSKWGHEYAFLSNETDSTDLNECHVPEPERFIFTRKTNRFVEMDDDPQEPIEIPKSSKEDIIGWIKESHRNSRGFEIGTFNVSLLATIMKKQSQRWEPFALGYISDMIAMVHTFVTKASKLKCPDERVCQNLLSILTDSLADKYKTAREQVKYLLTIEPAGTLKTLSHHFTVDLEKIRQERVLDAVEKKSSFMPTNGKTAVSIDDIVHEQRMSNDEHTAHDIHDILQSYYVTARQRFVDNVCMQAADYHLVTGPHTPMKMFSPSFVGGLTDEQLEEIAGEEPALQRRRKQLKKKVLDLEVGRKILM